MTIGKLAAAAALALCAAAGAAQANQLVNGDFEAASGPYALPSGWTYSTAVTGGPMNAPNLFVTDGAAYGACCGTTGSAAAQANRFATFGAGDSPNAGAFLGQDFGAIVGQTYRVTFDLAAFGAAGTQGFHVRIDDLTGLGHLAHGDFTVASSPDLDTGFTTFTLDFTAVGVHNLITFQNSAAVTNDIDGIVDNVSIVAFDPAAAVPEPATWALLLTGFAAAGVTLRRRRVSFRASWGGSEARA